MMMIREQRVFADHREWVVLWQHGSYIVGDKDYPAIEIVSVHATNEDTLEVEADVTDQIDGTDRHQKIYRALEVALQEEREE
jgi:hypothetical protein